MTRALPATDRASGSPRRLARYEMRVRTVLSAALVASFPVRASRTAVRRHSLYRVYVRGDRDLADVVRLLEQHGVEVLDIRLRPLPA